MSRRRREMGWLEDVEGANAFLVRRQPAPPALLGGGTVTCPGCGWSRPARRPWTLRRYRRHWHRKHT